MNQPVTIDDVINTAIQFSGKRKPGKHITLDAFGALDLTPMIAIAGRGKLYAERNAYVGQPLRLRVVEMFGNGFAPFADFTKVHAPAGIPQDAVLVKTYSENAPLRTILLSTGYFSDSGRRVPIGYAELEVWLLTQAFVDAFASSNAAAIQAARTEALRATRKAA